MQHDRGVRALAVIHALFAVALIAFASAGISAHQHDIERLHVAIGVIDQSSSFRRGRGPVELV